ncbi:hypothetical protein [Phreatobacter stygius]|uniref:Sensor histidine kinase n=1 Tax=Phreatobacter stygius TaxID=1940610 RepID=A0A4D7BEB1_9HYPH|nr:hypothetical protein [Phreatobacter stygius]QCI68813.1 hypothetical protein E8M01_34030 [Phreatobacter stygius]
MAVTAAWRRWLQATRGWQPRLRWAAAFAAAAIVLAAGTALATQHFDHYAARARISERSLLAEILAQPLCMGATAVRADRPVAPP